MKKRKDVSNRAQYCWMSFTWCSWAEKYAIHAKCNGHIVKCRWAWLNCKFGFSPPPPPPQKKKNLLKGQFQKFILAKLYGSQVTSQVLYALTWGMLEFYPLQGRPLQKVVESQAEHNQTVGTPLGFPGNFLQQWQHNRTEWSVTGLNGLCIASHPQVPFIRSLLIGQNSHWHYITTP